MSEEKLTTQEKLVILEQIADEFGDSFRDEYSGRGMYGSTCAGITTDDAMQIIEEAASRGIRGARTDNMGLKSIVYWPSVDTTKKEKVDA